MSDVKISDLHSGTAVQGTELVPVVQGGVTVSLTTDQFIDRTGEVGGATASFSRLNLKEPSGGGIIPLFQMDSHADGGVTKANLNVIGTSGGVSGTWNTSASLQVATGFGCNSKTPQTAVAVNAASVDLASVIALCNQLRAALIANGICQ